MPTRSGRGGRRSCRRSSRCRRPRSARARADGIPSSRQTSSVTAWKTCSGGASPATSVATLRSAACSSASRRCSASARRCSVKSRTDRDDLVRAARHHPRLEPMPDAVDLELVLDRAHLRRVSSASRDAGDQSLGEIRRQDVAHVASDHLVGRIQEGRRVVRAHVEIGAVTCRRGYIRSGIASSRARSRSSTRLHGLEGALVRERETGRGADRLEQLRTQPQRAVVDEQRRPARPGGRSASRRASPPGRQRDRRAGAVDVAAVFASLRASSSDGSPSARRSASSQPGRRRPLAQLDEQLADRCARQAAPATASPRNAAGSASEASRPRPMPIDRRSRRERREARVRSRTAAGPPCRRRAPERADAALAARRRAHASGEHCRRPRRRCRPQPPLRAPRVRSRATRASRPKRRCADGRCASA